MGDEFGGSSGVFQIRFCSTVRRMKRKYEVFLSTLINFSPLSTFIFLLPTPAHWRFNLDNWAIGGVNGTSEVIVDSGSSYIIMQEKMWNEFAKQAGFDASATTVPDTEGQRICDENVGVLGVFY